jgi:PAS domain S-box-containing protein
VDESKLQTDTENIDATEFPVINTSGAVPEKILLAAKENGTYDELHKKWFSPDMQPRIPFREILKRAVYILIPLAILMSIIMILVLRSEVNRKTKDLRQEITDHKQTEKELRKSEEKYRRLVENLKKEFFFYTHDANGIMTYVSPSVTEMLGYSQEEFLAHYSKYLSDNPINTTVVERTKESIKGIKQPPYLAEIYHNEGGTRWLEINEAPVFDMEGMVVAVEGIAHDITESKQAEDEIRHQLS